MKSTGIVRNIDNLGRVVIPMELRKTLDLKTEDSMEIFVDGESIILRKYVRGCVFCSGMDDLKPFGGHDVCGKCRETLRNGLAKEKAL